MRTPRLYTPQPLPLGQTIELEAAAGHYIGKVLRMQEKQEVILFNDAVTQAVRYKYLTPLVLPNPRLSVLIPLVVARLVMLTLKL